MFGIQSVASFGTFATTMASSPAVRHGFRIVAIIACTLLVQRFLDRIIARIICRAVSPGRYITPDAERKREDTLIRIVDGAARLTVWFIAAFAVLTEFQVSTTPFVTAAGTLGFAVALGGQHVICDVVIGACMMVEDQYRVGDTVSINGTTGIVRDVALRITTLVDARGTVHYFSHRLITTVANLREHNTPPAG